MSDKEDDNVESGGEDDAKEEKKGKKKKTGTKRKSKGPKKALTAYVFFCNEKRQGVKADNPDASFGDIGKKLGALWKELSDSEKKKYQKMQAKDKERYEKEKAEMPEGEGDDDDQPKKKRKTGKAKKEPGEPKKAKSAYMFFCDDERKKLKEENPDMVFAEVNKALGDRWRQLSDEDKKPYNEKFNEAKAIADKAKADWVAEHPDAKDKKKRAKKTTKKKKKKDGDDEGGDDEKAEAGDDDAGGDD
jgi:arsenate reductase-like glutaredoxin family protein